jgi:hypothetical protein
MNSSTVVGVTISELWIVAGAIVTAIWWLGRAAVGQLNERISAKFKVIDDKLATFDPLHGELARVDKDLVQVRLEMATNFVRQEGLHNLQLRMEQLFGEVFDKLESKADKSECERAHPHK